MDQVAVAGPMLVRAESPFGEVVKLLHAGIARPGYALLDDLFAAARAWDE
jgi:hypothetical protein